MTLNTSKIANSTVSLLVRISATREHTCSVAMIIATQALALEMRLVERFFAQPLFLPRAETVLDRAAAEARERKGLTLHLVSHEGPQVGFFVRGTSGVHVPCFVEGSFEFFN